MIEVIQNCGAEEIYCFSKALHVGTMCQTLGHR